ncbi:MarR family winged helix-turn-helix transcriptional regulator [Alicyclobacillus mengziensis]|uniref:MarR family winged helix-turn-helix transcriptional regulator n=1 Tax=Alicyclobacillus mengziensis TaxID=2931921 RepID=UPI002013732B|nr:MarR family winged helix-turn-helix transcriptional regulator [Alicyclobacillus mengziensis]
MQLLYYILIVELARRNTYGRHPHAFASHDCAAICRDSTAYLGLLYTRHGDAVLNSHGAPPGARALHSGLGGAHWERSPVGKRVVEGLRVQGWVERHPAPQDRRHVQVRLTAAGQREATQLHVALNQQAEDLLAHLPPGRRAATMEALAWLADALEADSTRLTVSPVAPAKFGRGDSPVAAEGEAE